MPRQSVAATSWGATGGQCLRNGSSEGDPSLNSGNLQPPFAYRWRKPGRGDGWPVVAKLTHFLGATELILAVCWRNQRGTRDAISEPRMVLLDAQRRGARWAYLRDDGRMLMWRISITGFLRGRLQPDGEQYVLLRHMEPCAWRGWAYAERELWLEPQPGGPQPPSRQLALFDGVSP